MILDLAECRLEIQIFCRKIPVNGMNNLATFGLVKRKIQ